MRNTISAIALLGMVTMLPAAALASPSKEESIGVGSGAVIGAVAGGPVGFIVGAAVGAKIGDSFHRKNEKIDTLSVSLDRSQDQVHRLDTDIDALGSELERLQGIARPEVMSLLEAGIEMDLLFRTDEAALSESTEGRLDSLAETLASMPDVRVRLDGFADERGDETYNQALSGKRVEYVRSRLLAAGVDSARISAAAHGESPASEQSADSYALERRVSLTLFVDDTPSLAANPAD